MCILYLDPSLSQDNYHTQLRFTNTNLHILTPIISIVQSPIAIVYKRVGMIFSAKEAFGDIDCSDRSHAIAIHDTTCIEVNCDIFQELYASTHSLSIGNSCVRSIRHLDSLQ